MLKDLTLLSSTHQVDLRIQCTPCWISNVSFADVGKQEFQGRQIMSRKKKQMERLLISDFRCQGTWGVALSTERQVYRREEKRGSPKKLSRTWSTNCQEEFWDNSPVTTEYPLRTMILSPYLTLFKNINLDQPRYQDGNATSLGIKINCRDVGLGNAFFTIILKVKAINRKRSGLGSIRICDLKDTLGKGKDSP